MKQHRYQRGSLQIRKPGGRRIWIVLYYRTDGKRGYHEIGPASEMSKKEAQQACDEWMAEHVNGGSAGKPGTTRTPTVREFIEETYLLFAKRKWKGSTAHTETRRIEYHIVGEFGDQAMDSLTLMELQDALQRKADAGTSESIVKQVKYHMRAIWRMAQATGVISVDPTPALYTPRIKKLRNAVTMTQEEVVRAIGALPPREALMLHLTCLAGMRPGEMMALQRKHVIDIESSYAGFGVDGDTHTCTGIEGEAEARRSLKQGEAPTKRPSVQTSLGGSNPPVQHPNISLSLRIEQRVYEGVIDDPKTRQSHREVALAPETATILAQWLQDAVESAPEAYLFAAYTGEPTQPGRGGRWYTSETGKPVSYANVLRRIIKPILRTVGLEWFNWQVARRTHASLGHDAGIDPRVGAAQRGHNIGTSLDVYTQPSQESKADAAKKLAGKVLAMPPQRKQA